MCGDRSTPRATRIFPPPRTFPQHDPEFFFGELRLRSCVWGGCAAEDSNIFIKEKRVSVMSTRQPIFRRREHSIELKICQHFLPLSRRGRRRKPTKGTMSCWSLSLPSSLSVMVVGKSCTKYTECVTHVWSVCLSRTHARTWPALTAHKYVNCLPIISNDPPDSRASSADNAPPAIASTTVASALDFAIFFPGQIYKATLGVSR